MSEFQSVREKDREEKKRYFIRVFEESETEKTSVTHKKRIQNLKRGAHNSCIYWNTMQYML